MIPINNQACRKISFAFAAMLLIVSPVYSQIGSIIQTPQASAIAELAGEKSLHDMAFANLVASNCEIKGVTKGDAALIGGTAQAVAKHMNLNMEDYFSRYVQPAIVKLTTLGACENHATMTTDVLRKIKELGGEVLN